MFKRGDLLILFAKGINFPPPPIPSTNYYLLLEDGFNLLLEDGEKIELEAST